MQKLIIFLPAVDPGPEGGDAFWLLRLLLIGNVLLNVPFDLLSSLALYTIAKRWHMPRPWLAWLPVGNLWMLGALADDAAAPGKRRLPRRWIMLAVGLVLAVVLPVGVLYDAGCTLPGALLAGNAIGLMVWLAVIFGSMVFSFMSLEAVYRVCRPEKSALYTLLSILLSIPIPFCLLSCAFSGKRAA